MTIEELKQYRGLCADIDAIWAELEAVYMPIRSPTGNTNEGHGTTPGNPTEQAAFKAMAVQERLIDQLKEQERIRLEIESWLMTVEDPELSALVRWHYIIGLTWEKTALKVYGAPHYYRAKKKIHRFFHKIS